MGKKQKIKKAAAAAKAATAAAAAAVVKEDVAADNNNKEWCENHKEKFAALSPNKQQLLKLNQVLLSKPSCEGHAEDEDTSSDSSSSNGDSDDATVVQDEENTAAATDGGAGVSSKGPDDLAPVTKYSRGEKKARRLLMKLDLEHMQNVSRVTMRKGKNVMLCIDRPQVYKCPNTKTLICFGEVRIEDTSNTAAAQAAERYLNDSNSPSKDVDQLIADKQDNNDADDDEAADDSQLDEKDIELVQMQTGCSRPKAVKALIKHMSDVVNAIMDLSEG